MKHKHVWTKLQTEWVNDLISSRYKQVKGRLCEIKGKSYSYCCLGVACRTEQRLAKEEGRKSSVVRVSMMLGTPFLLFNDESAALDEEMVNQLGLNSSNGLITDSLVAGKYANLAQMNDGNMTHKQIGEYIRAHPETVFAQVK